MNYICPSPSKCTADQGRTYFQVGLLPELDILFQDEHSKHAFRSWYQFPEGDEAILSCTKPHSKQDTRGGVDEFKSLGN